MGERQCCELVFSKRVSRSGSSRAYPCRKSATVTREGKRYCATHDPDAVEARKRKFWDRAAQDSRIQENAASRRLADAARLALYPRLVAELANIRDWFRVEGAPLRPQEVASVAALLAEAAKIEETKP